jgi:YVTN family beta-propeller protein
MTPRLKSASVLIAACLLTATARGQPYVEDSIDVGGAWVGSMCYNSRADVICGRCQTAGLFWAIACSTNQVVSSFYVPTPRIMVYDSLDNKVYCTFTTGDADSVLVVDGNTHRRLRAIELEWAATPVWDPADNRVWVSCTEANEVAAIDCRTDSVVCHLAVGAGPLKMHLNTRHRKLYVQNYDEGSVSIIDLSTNRLLGTLPIGQYPQSGCYSSYADKYYCDGGGRVTVIDGRGDSIIGRIALPPRSYATALVAVEDLGLVMTGVYDEGGPCTIRVVDANHDSVIRVLDAGDDPRAMHWSPTTSLEARPKSLDKRPVLC